MLQSSQAYRSRKMLKRHEAIPCSSFMCKNNKGKEGEKLGNLAVNPNYKKRVEGG